MSRRFVLAASLIGAMILAFSPVSAVATATLTFIPIPYEVSLDYCSHAELIYSSGAEANNLTVFGVDGVDSPVVPAEGPVCWRTTGDVFFSDLQATISTTPPGCRTLGPLRTAFCETHYFDRLLISTGDGKDSIRVGPSQILIVEIDAGDGPDAIRALNRGYDIISCGPGVDSVIADRGDSIGGDCENVQLVV